MGSYPTPRVYPNPCCYPNPCSYPNPCCKVSQNEHRYARVYPLHLTRLYPRKRRTLPRFVTPLFGRATNALSRLSGQATNAPDKRARVCAFVAARLSRRVCRAARLSPEGLMFSSYLNYMSCRLVAILDHKSKDGSV